MNTSHLAEVDRRVHLSSHQYAPNYDPPHPSQSILLHLRKCHPTTVSLRIRNQLHLLKCRSLTTTINSSTSSSLKSLFNRCRSNSSKYWRHNKSNSGLTPLHRITSMDLELRKRNPLSLRANFDPF